MKILFATGTLPPAFPDPRVAFPDDEVIVLPSGGPYTEARHATVALLGLVTPDQLRNLLSTLGGVRWLQSTGAGIERLLIPELLQREDVVLTNNRGAFDVSMAELAIGGLFAGAKRFPEYFAAQSMKEWRPDVAQRQLRDAVLVVVGLGSIGAEVARIASAIGMRVFGVRRTAGGAGPGTEKIVTGDQLESIIGEADYVVVAAPLTAETRGLVSADVLRRMKHGAWIVNIGRGYVVDEDALFEALQAGRLGGALIDAWWQEPLPPDSRWWSLANVIVTPHSARWSSVGVPERTYRLFAENLQRFKLGKPLLNVVDKKRGY